MHRWNFAQQNMEQYLIFDSPCLTVMYLNSQLFGVNKLIFVKKNERVKLTRLQSECMNPANITFKAVVHSW